MNFIGILGTANWDMLFGAEDMSNHAGLLVYNGKTAYELRIVGASPNGLAPNNSTEYNGDVWFSGYDATGNDGLWYSNGTAAGTKEVTGIAGASATGFDPNNLTPYNGKLLFEAVDSKNNEALWISDGTAAGTQELCITGVNWEGSFPVLLRPLAVYDGEAYFDAADSSGLDELWVTNGTVSGTHEVTGIVGGDQSGSGLNPSNLTVYGGLLLFSGTDSAGDVGLWVYNGTEGHELTPISGAASTGVDPYGITPTNVFGGGGQKINLAYLSGAAANLFNTAGDRDEVTGSDGTVALTSAQALVTGSGNTVKMGADSDLSVSGSNDKISAASGDVVNMNSGTGDTIMGTAFTVSALSGTGVTVGGNGESGTVDVIKGSSATVGVEANSHADVIGSNDKVTIASGAASVLGLNGSNDTVSTSSGDTVNMNSGDGDTITGTGLTVSALSRVGFKIVGKGDFVYAGLDDALTDGGTSTAFKIKGNVGALSIYDFGTDSTGIIDLLGGNGGYKTAAAAFAALTSDGSGGSLLSLAATGDGTIDIHGVAPSSLHVTNFKIG